MSTDLVVAQIPAKHISFTRTRSGWLFRHDRSVSATSFSMHAPSKIYMYMSFSVQIQNIAFNFCVDRKRLAHSKQISTPFMVSTYDRANGR